ALPWLASTQNGFAMVGVHKTGLPWLASTQNGFAMVGVHAKRVSHGWRPRQPSTRMASWRPRQQNIVACGWRGRRPRQISRTPTATVVEDANRGKPTATRSAGTTLGQHQKQRDCPLPEQSPISSNRDVRLFLALRRLFGGVFRF